MPHSVAVHRSTHRSAHRTVWAGLFAAGLLVAFAVPAQTRHHWLPPTHTSQGITYLNAGISEEQEAQMNRIARNWPLRIIFSERKDNDFVANANVKIVDQQGKAVLKLDNIGPMLYAEVPPGKYRISAQYNGITKLRDVTVGSDGSSSVYIHWKGKPNIDPWDGRPMGGNQVPG